jgi:hypothetical protein
MGHVFLGGVGGGMGCVICDETNGMVDITLEM